MKKFSVRKISALVLVFCLFVSVFANTGIFTVRAEEEVSTGASASLTYAGESGYWFGVTGYANADKTDWPSVGWLTDGTSSDGNVTVNASDGKWIIAWDTTNVSEVYVTFGANINGTNYEVYKTLGDGANITLYDSETGLTTEAPVVDEPEAETVTATFNYHGTSSYVCVIGNGYSDANGWVPDCNTWQTGSDDRITFGGSGNTFTLSWDPAKITELYVIFAGNNANGSWNQDLKVTVGAGSVVNVYDTADGNAFTTQAPSTDEDGDTVSATVTYAGASTGYWFGATGCANADKTDWPSFGWLAGGSNDYVTISQTGASWTVTWDPAKVSEVYAEFGANINGADQKVWPTLTAGANITYYDAADGTLTTEQPKSTASINYLGTAGDPIIIVSSYIDPDGNTVAANDGWWVQASDDNFTFGEGNKSVSWTNPDIVSINAIIGGMINGNWVSDLRVTMGAGTVTDIYDNADASNFSTEEPGAAAFTATATITYMGSQSVWTGSDGAWVIADNAWVNSWLSGPGSNDYASISHSGTTYSISWNPEVASPNFRFGVYGEFEDEYAPELYDGAAYVLYDGDGELTTELPAKYSSAKVVYMGSKSHWITSIGLTPHKTYADGWWVDDNASPDAPFGTYTMCYASGTTYTFTWDANFADKCWVMLGTDSVPEGGSVPSYGLTDGQVVYIYDDYSCSVVVEHEEGQSTWSGVSAVCLTNGQWVSGLWIDGGANDYGISQSVTTDGTKTTYHYTWDRFKVSTICVQVGTTNLEGNNSNIWLNFSANGSSRTLYVNEADGNLTTFRPGTAYTKPGAGEGIDGTLKVHYIREDANYTGWYFGWWYEVDGQWFSYNEKFDAEGLYTIALNDIPAKQIGFVVNYNDWASKDVEQDRFIEISKLVADENGDYNVYLYSGDATVYYEPKA